MRHYSAKGAPVGDSPFFTARLRPHRSLPRRGRYAVLAVFGLFQGTLGVVCGVAGAWPATFFLALTWFGLALAFARNARAARAYEDIALSPYELHYVRVSPAGTRRDWRFNPLWVRLAVERRAECGVERLDLFARRRRLEIGAFLGRNEKALLVEELGAALARARGGPRFS